MVRVSSESVRKQRSRTERIRRGRNNHAVRHGLDILQHKAIRGENLMESIIACVRDYATVGEISDVLRGVFGEFSEKPIF